MAIVAKEGVEGMVSTPSRLADRGGRMSQRAFHKRERDGFSSLKGPLSIGLDFQRVEGDRYAVIEKRGMSVGRRRTSASESTIQSSATPNPFILSHS